MPLIGVPTVWNAGYRGEGIEIAILDTGINASHPDLDDLDDLSTTTDPKVVRAVDFTDDGTTADLHGHGTHVASIASGTGASSADANTGVAPAATLWNVKVLAQDGSGLSSWIISGIEYAFLGPDGQAGTGDEADVINMSLGEASNGDGTDPMSIAVDEAVDAGVVAAVSAGNEGSSMMTVGEPGAARKAITVGASNDSDGIASFSSRGPTADLRLKPDVVAPGFLISAADYLTSGYTTKNGTSMAAPHVAGLAALILQSHPTWDPIRVKAAIMNTALALDGYNLWDQGAGRIRAIDAVSTTLLAIEPSISFGELYGGYPASSTITVYNFAATSTVVGLVATTTFGTTTLSNATVTPSSLVIPPGASGTVILTVGPAVEDALGYYQGRISLSHTNGVITVPYLYALDLPPDVAVTPSSITSTTDHLAPVTTTLTVSNSGAGDLVFIMTTTALSSAVCFAPNSGNVSPASSTPVTVTLNCDGSLPPGANALQLLVKSNDPASSIVSIGVQLQVNAPDIGVNPMSFAFALGRDQTTSTTLTVSNTGTGTLAFLVAVEQPNVSGGPDAAGYVWSDSDDAQGPPFSWIEIGGLGTQIGSGDDKKFAIPIGFDFRFYGATYTTAYVDTNGLITFATTSAHTALNSVLPSTISPNNLIAAFWDDLDVQSADRLLYHLTGTAPARKLVVQWDGVQEFGDAGASHTFQVVLDEATGNVTVQYLSMSGDLDSATVGMENSDGTTGLTTAFNEGYVKDGLAVLFSQATVYASVNVTSSIVVADGNVGLGLTIDSTGLEDGTYSADVVLDSNDPDEAQVRVPITLTVPIPSLGEWGLIVLTLLFAAALVLTRRPAPARSEYP